MARSKQKAARPTGTQGILSRLAALPRSSELVIEGGKRSLGLNMRENKQIVQPQVALWVEADSGFVRAVRIINPSESSDDGSTEALQVLMEALARPVGAPSAPSRLSMPSPAPGLPAKLMVNDQALAEIARNLLAPLDITIEYAEDLPDFDAAFRDLSAAIGADPDGEQGPPEPFDWEIAEDLLPSLYKAAAGYWRRAPWEYLGSDVPIAIELGNHGPQPGVGSLYAVVLGNAGEVFGAAFYYSLDGFERTMHHGEEHMEREEAGMSDVPTGEHEDQRVDELIEMLRRSGAPVDEVPPEALRDMVTSLMGSQGMSGEDEQAEGEPMAKEEYLEVIEDSLFLDFNSEYDSDPTYLDWLAERKLKYASRAGVPSFHRLVERSGPVRPTEREVRALTLAIEALNRFFSAHRSLLDHPEMGVYPLMMAGKLTYTANVGAGNGKGKGKADGVEVKMSLPAEDYDWRVVLLGDG
jgi:hypothetical protein